MGFLDTKLGAVFIGNVLAACLYGTACIQVYNYFIGNHKDSVRFRLLLCVLWLSDTTQLVFVTYALYHYTVTNFNNPLALLSVNWSMLSCVFCTCISGIIVRGTFTRRVWLITKGNKILVTIIALASLSSFVTGFAFAISAFRVATFLNLRTISYYLYTAFASGSMADILIASSLCYSLSKRRTGFKRTDSLITTLILFAINSSKFSLRQQPMVPLAMILTKRLPYSKAYSLGVFQFIHSSSARRLITHENTKSLCSIGSLITYAIWPTDFIYIAVFFSQSKMYTISLFASLNSRERLREKTTAASDIPLSLPGRSWKPSTVEEQHDPVQTNHSVVVTIERKVQIDRDEIVS
ncbi:hypothetical protein AX15_007365 [Amanita polypyramis BW_CC]|nr:hypothetical protein AX15_007365 [Amanita polypyramis BW_CC]